MKSAVFVDFDNVFSQLRQLQPEVAERFARQPTHWINWLVDALALPKPSEDGDRRRLLGRRCYLNPNWYQAYRHAFLRAGFEIVDCPPVTSQGKTSTDIHMVLDIIDLLQAETRCDEFIVFSADADFTPVLRKLRRHDRRTTVLAIGFPSAAYQASADLLIDERLFVREALRIGPPAAEPAPAPTPPPTGLRDEMRVVESKVAGPDPKQQNGAGDAAPAAETALKPNPRAATADELSEIASRLWKAVEESPTPVSAGALASQLKADFPDVLSNWNGVGTFKAFFRSLGLSRLEWGNGPGGRVMDPSRHEVDSAPVDLGPESAWAGAEDIFPVAREVAILTGAPLLAPKHLKLLMHALVEVQREQAFKLPTTVQLVCRRCVDPNGVRLRPRDVNFIVRGLQMNGHVFGQGDDDAHTLSTRLFDQILFLCVREQKALTPSETEKLRTWIAVAPGAG